jgi:cysteinyl-tRNA synthetase
MDSDLNTPAAIAELQMLRSDVNKLLGTGLSTQGRHQARQSFRSLGAVLGLFQLDHWEYGMRAEAGQYQISGSDIEAKLAERLEAKKNKDFKRADEIRQELKALGITIEDKPDGTTRWKR